MSMSTRSKTAQLAARRTEPAPIQPPAPPASPDIAPDGSAPADKCSICLCSIVNKCKTNCCRHEFCFSCLLEWSKVKAECPLCKASVSSIIHNIRDVDGQQVHDTYTVPPVVDESSRFVQYLNYNFGPPQPLPMGIRLTAHEVAGAFSLGSFDSYLQSIVHFTPRLTARRPAAASTSNAHSSRRVPVGISRGVEDYFGDMLPDGLSIPVNDMNGFMRGVERELEDAMGLPSAEEMLRRFTEDAPGPHGSSFDNPFVRHDDDGSAGAELYPSDEMRRAPSSQGYQRRKRIYARGQYVDPFSSGLQRGAVFFPSIEYFRTHATALTRIQGWLKRELVALLALTTSRSRLAAIYELIVSMLPRHDIRSREFREMLRVYFDSTARVKHFQHEFYHFVLSGLQMAAYDSVASYPSTSARSTSGRTTGNSSVPIVTIDDNDDEDTASRPTDSGQSPGYHEGRWRRLRERSSELHGMDLTNGRHRTEEESSRQRDDGAGPSRRARSKSRDDPRPRKKPRTTTKSANDNGGDESGSDDCQLLGIHPIIKPPPLAVITIDSDASDHEVPSTSQFGYYEPSAPTPSQSASASVAGPSQAGGSHPSAPLYEVADSPSSSSSVYVVQEVGKDSSGVKNDRKRERPSSPKPSTSAAARACLNGYMTAPMKKSDYLLQRMFDDLDSNSNDQDDEVNNWMTEHFRDCENQPGPYGTSPFEPPPLDIDFASLSHLPEEPEEDSECEDLPEFLRKEYGAIQMKLKEELCAPFEQSETDNWDYTLFAPPSRDNTEEDVESSLSSPTEDEVELVLCPQEIGATPYSSSDSASGDDENENSK